MRSTVAQIVRHLKRVKILGCRPPPPDVSLRRGAFYLYVRVVRSKRALRRGTEIMFCTWNSLLYILCENKVILKKMILILSLTKKAQNVK